MEKNLIRFDEFLNTYLYGKDGYYSSYKTGTDYSTLPEISSSFSKFLAFELKRLILKNNLKSACIVDLGAGSGRLAASLAFYNEIPVFAVEISEARRMIIEESFKHIKNLYVVSSIPDKDNFSAAFTIAHEFFDALPVRVFKKDNKGLKELFLNSKNKSLEYEAPNDIPEYVLKFTSLIPVGTVFEYSPYYEEIIRRLSEFKHTLVIVIDYGFSIGEMDRVKSGTLRSFFKNKFINNIESVIWSSTKADITHSVNFTILDWVFESYGFDKKLFMSLGRFVTHTLLEREKMLSHEEEKELLKAIVPHRFGDSFYISIYTKDTKI